MLITIGKGNLRQFEKNGLYHRGQAATEFSQEDLVARGWMASGLGEC
jgi:hypothetical protein